MVRRVLLTVILIAASGWHTHDAAGQPALPDHHFMVSEHTMVREIGSFVHRAFHPVKIISADVPESLAAGEEGLFSAHVNVEHATLPLSAVWEFSDGTKRSGISVRHAFTKPGRYRVRFHVANGGSEASENFEVEIYPSESGDST